MKAQNYEDYPLTSGLPTSESESRKPDNYRLFAITSMAKMIKERLSYMERKLYRPTEKEETQWVKPHLGYD